MNKDIFKLQFRQLQNEINRRESIDNNLCTECFSKDKFYCGCSNNVVCLPLKGVPNQDLNMMRLQFRESNDPNDEDYDIPVTYPEDNKIMLRGAFAYPDYLWFTFVDGRLIRQVTSRSYNKNACAEYDYSEIYEPNVYGGTYSEL
tara:strand:+ start:10666 stop:11100 length:435 start_codon:yes stop_codon:yes gene_type:complete